jgi:hypothetical protein
MNKTTNYQQKQIKTSLDLFRKVWVEMPTKSYFSYKIVNDLAVKDGKLYFPFKATTGRTYKAFIEWIEKDNIEHTKQVLKKDENFRITTTTRGTENDWIVNLNFKDLNYKIIYVIDLAPYYEQDKIEEDFKNKYDVAFDEI